VSFLLSQFSKHVDFRGYTRHKFYEPDTDVSSSFELKTKKESYVTEFWKRSQGHWRPRVFLTRGSLKQSNTHTNTIYKRRAQTGTQMHTRLHTHTHTRISKLWTL